MGRLYEAYRRVNAAGRTEDSVFARGAVLASVLTAVVAIWMEGAASTFDVGLALVLLPVGSVLSHVRRDRDNTVVKLLLTVGAAIALYRFFGQLRSIASLEDARIPLANLFLAVQILHSFDLPRRRDLGFTLASSLALVALAGAAARGMAFGWALAAYLCAAAVAAYALQWSATLEQADEAAGEDGHVAFRIVSERGGQTRGRGGDRAGDEGGGRAVGVGRSRRALASLGKATAAALLVGLLAFLVLPRTDSVRFGGLPFSGLPGASVGGVGVDNPGLPFGGSQAGGSGSGFNPDAYYGLAEHVDLRTRGRLSDEVVMRVRSSQPRLWRGMVFDRYERSGWSRTATEPRELHGTPVYLQRLSQSPANPVPVVQTYELVEDTPNLVFAAADPMHVYLSAGSIAQWEDGTLTTPSEQTAGTVYSVVSAIDATPPAQLREAFGPLPGSVSEAYLELPEDLPPRVAELGRELTSPTPSFYAKAEAVQAWLGDNVEYSLDDTRQPAGADAVDWFLFEHRRGWCEQIASSMVLLLRAGGVPARFATGFAPGTRNPFTGWYEVRMSDAHAWVEAWVPNHGWVQFDPTGAVPEAVSPTQTGSRIALLDLAEWIGDLVPDDLVTRAREAGRWLAARGRLVALVAVVLGGAAVVLLMLRRRSWSSRGGGRRGSGRGASSPSAFDRLEDLLREDGVLRDDWQTPREFVARIRLHRPRVPDGALRDLLAEEELRRYADGARRAPSRDAPSDKRLELVHAALVPGDEGDEGP